MDLNFHTSFKRGGGWVEGIQILAILKTLSLYCITLLLLSLLTIYSKRILLASCLSHQNLCSLVLRAVFG
jgi:hypothetical protein